MWALWQWLFGSGKLTCPWDPGWAEPRTTARPPCSVNHPGHHACIRATRVNQNGAHAIREAHATRDHQGTRRAHSRPTEWWSAWGGWPVQCMGEWGTWASRTRKRGEAGGGRLQSGGQRKPANDPRSNQHNPGTPTTGHLHCTNGTRRNQHSPGTPTMAGGVLKELDFFLLRTALRDRPKGPSTANHQPPPTANRHQLPTANRCQPPAATNRQPPTTANRHQPPIPNHQLPPTTTNRHQPPPTTSRQPPTANTWCARGLFWENCVMQHVFFPPSRTARTTALCERGNNTSWCTGSSRQKAATRRNMRREERVTVQGPVNEQQPDGMSHGGYSAPPPPLQCIPAWPLQGTAPLRRQGDL